jgi:phosphate:Na+ symporter
LKTVDLDIWLFIAGLGVFLFGMFHLENGLKGLAGNSFKKLLYRFTNRSWKGILTGFFVTAILQSSSLVTLLVLAFLGAGMISLQNSLSVVFGANLGTTVTAWIVAAIGFKLDIADFSFPFLAIGTLSYLLLDKRPVFKNWGSFLIGFGLLFLGLGFMKTSIENVAEQVDLSLYANLGLWVFLLIGIFITVLIQSSSAMIVIVLSALNADLLTIHQSVAMIIGANIGTTSTLIIASVKGTADKKRLAAANVIFNLVAGTLCFFLLNNLVYFTIHWLHIEEPLMELVFLNTIINLMGIVIFLPFIPNLARLMNNQF